MPNETPKGVRGYLGTGYLKEFGESISQSTLMG